MIDFRTEDPITLAQASRLLPKRRAGRTAHQSTLHRWASIGLKGIVLETIQVGGTRCTSKEALQRFFDELTARRATPGTPAPTSRQRRASIASAEAFLDAKGV